LKSTMFLVDVSPYGTEKAYGVLYAAIVCMASGSAIGLYGDGTYLALAGQNSKSLGMPNLADIIYAYPEVRILAHEPSIVERGLMGKKLIELVELQDEDEFLREVSACDAVITL
jgi:tRNA 2-thiouridine synthesizing protein C